LARLRALPRLFPLRKAAFLPPEAKAMLYPGSLSKGFFISHPSGAPLSAPKGLRWQIQPHLKE
jgi:hypothetical protein